MAKVQANVVNMDQSGRQSMANFSERKTGDAVVTYENELLLRNKEGEAIPYVVPPATLLIESPVAIVESRSTKHGNREVVEAFLEFLFSAEGQRIFAEYGFRPVRRPGRAADPAIPPPPKLFTMADLGGWARMEEELYSTKGLWTTIAAERARTGGSDDDGTPGPPTPPAVAVDLILRGTSLFYLGDHGRPADGRR